MHRFTAPGRLFAVLALCLFSAASRAQDLTAFSGPVTAVTAGDEITVADNKGREHKVRLAAMDAPEPGQQFFDVAKKYLSDLLLENSVTVVGRRTDPDGRLIAQVFLLGRDVSYSMIWAGLAWHDKEIAKDQSKEDRKNYTEAERFARRTKENIWSISKPVPPWDFRKDNPLSNENSDTAALKPPVQPVPVAATITYGPALEIVGNKRSKTYHWNPGCPGFSKISEKNRISFSSREEAEAAGYKPGKNCREPFR